MAKTKKVMFNVFRPFIEKYIGPEIKSNERYNFYELIQAVQNSISEEIFTEYQGEKLILQKVVSHDDRLIHLQILKQREYDLPFQIKKNPDLVKNIEDQVINYDSTYQEGQVEVEKDSFLGEVMVLLYDIDNNSLVVQSNINCTSLKGLITLFSSIYNEEVLQNNNPDEYSLISLAAILNEPMLDQASSLQTYSELEVVVEDNDMFKSADAVINKDNTLGAQRIKMHYYLDTNKDKKKSLLKDKVREVISELRSKNKSIKTLNVKGRESEDGLLESFELVRERLRFSHVFSANKENKTLNPNAVVNEMANKYKTKKIGNKTIQELSKL
ncbi:DUF6731 family protein [Jeotgalicoccus halotolerans]|uniref:DUF6731 family protein n=1 Tax=Jeotgalicoccus halotolerans TaxID=157227 RepID=UPI003514494C